jgi:hypothetical protein
MDAVFLRMMLFYQNNGNRPCSGLISNHPLLRLIKAPLLIVRIRVIFRPRVILIIIIFLILFVTGTISNLESVVIFEFLEWLYLRGEPRFL